MKFQVDRDTFADAVSWTAKSLPARPSVPVLAGARLSVDEGKLTISGFDYEISTRVTVDHRFSSTSWTDSPFSSG